MAGSLIFTAQRNLHKRRDSEIPPTQRSRFGDPSYATVAIRRSLLRNGRDSEIPPTQRSRFGDPSYATVAIRRSLLRNGRDSEIPPTFPIL